MPHKHIYREIYNPNDVHVAENSHRTHHVYIASISLKCISIYVLLAEERATVHFDFNLFIAASPGGE